MLKTHLKNEWKVHTGSWENTFPFSLSHYTHVPRISFVLFDQENQFPALAVVVAKPVIVPQARNCAPCFPQPVLAWLTFLIFA